MKLVKHTKLVKQNKMNENMQEKVKTIRFIKMVFQFVYFTSHVYC